MKERKQIGNKNNIIHLGNEVRRREKNRLKHQGCFGLSGFSSSKGQMFIIAAVIMLGGVILIFNVLGSKIITEEKKFQDTRLMDKVTKNVINEYMYLAGAATAMPVNDVNKSAADFAANFSSYIRSEMDSRIFYAIAVVNGTNQQYSVNIGNYLNRRINVTVNVTSSTPSGGSAFLEDMRNSTFNFASNVNGIVNVTINYRADGSKTEMFGINVSTKNFLIALFDVTIIDGNSQINIKDTYNRTW